MTMVMACKMARSRSILPFHVLVAGSIYAVAHLQASACVSVLVCSRNAKHSKQDALAPAGNNVVEAIIVCYGHCFGEV